MDFVAQYFFLVYTKINKLGEMKMIKRESISHVLVGLWTRRMFTPDYVAKEIIKNAELQLEFSFDLNIPVRFGYKEVVVVPDKDQLKIFSLSKENDSLLELTKITSAAIDKLSKVNLKFYGINFTYIIDCDDFNIDSLLDTSTITVLIEGEQLNSSIRTQYKTEEYTLNIAINEKGESISANFNYHHEYKDSTGFEEVLKTKTTDLLEKSDTIVRKLFGDEIIESAKLEVL